MVNDYYIENKNNSSTAMVHSKNLFISCKTHKTDLTEEAFRRNVDLAFIITKEFAAKKTEKMNEPVATSDHPPCTGCGGTFFMRTGTCHVCQTCGDSQGCS
jgi:hypothetical protein